MAEYRVTWAIDVEASSPEQAAEMALHIQRDPYSTAIVFEVQDTYHNDEGSVIVDLET